MPEKHKDRTAGVICFLLLLLVCLVYFPVLSFDFTNYDDPDYVTKNPHVLGGFTWQNIGWAITHFHSGNWHPLTWLSHMFDCQIYGLHAGGHHLSNLILHATNSVLLFFLLRSLTGANWRSGLVAALFATHPMHVESVAWIAERKDLLSTCFAFLSLRAYVLFATANTPGQPRRAPLPPGPLGLRDKSRLAPYFLAVVFYACGLMSKPMIVSLPMLMLLLDYWPLGRLRNLSGSTSDEMAGLKSTDFQNVCRPARPCFNLRGFGYLLAEKLPFFVLALASCVVTIAAQNASKAVTPLTQSSFGLRLGNAVVSYALYLGKLIWPIRLAVLYPEKSHWSWVVVFLAALFLVLITGFVLSQSSRRAWLLTGWAWFLFALIPVIGVVKVGNYLIADRYTYLPSVGVFLILAWGLELISRFSVFGSEARVAASHSASVVTEPSTTLNQEIDPTRRSRLAANFAVILLAVYILWFSTWLASSQVLIWRNTQTLFRHALSVTTGNYIAWACLAFDLADRKELKQAEQALFAALAINPALEPAWTKLALIKIDERRPAEAVICCRRALAIDSRSAGAHGALGLAFMKRGQTNEAVSQYLEALKIQPVYAEGHYNLANALAGQGQIEKAAEHYAAALRLDPNSPDAHNNLAYMLLRQGKLELAEAHFESALKLKPESWHARYGLGEALLRQAKFDSAITELSSVLRVQPDFDPARLQLANALEAQGRLDDAIRELKAIRQGTPAYAPAQYHLGLILERRTGGQTAPPRP